MERTYGLLIWAAMLVFLVGVIAAAIILLGGSDDAFGKSAGAFSFMVASLIATGVVCSASLLLFAAGAIGYIFKENQPKGWFWNYRWPLAVGAPGTGLGLAIIGWLAKESAFGL